MTSKSLKPLSKPAGKFLTEEDNNNNNGAEESNDEEISVIWQVNSDEDTSNKEVHKTKEDKTKEKPDAKPSSSPKNATDSTTNADVVNILDSDDDDDIEVTTSAASAPANTSTAPSSPACTPPPRKKKRREEDKDEDFSVEAEITLSSDTDDDVSFVPGSSGDGADRRKWRRREDGGDRARNGFCQNCEMYLEDTQQKEPWEGGVSEKEALRNGKLR